MRDRASASAPPPAGATTLDVPAALPAFARGDFIGDRYQVIDVLGEGGFGIVYLVRNLGTNSIAALKTLRSELLRDEKTRALFVKEARIWIELGAHPNLVRADGVDEIAGRLYISMEYVQAGAGRPNSLEGYLERGPIPEENALRWAIEFCRGMEYALSRGIRCHRDIKPANILIGGDGRVRISDFGIAGVALAPEAPKAGGDEATPSGMAGASTGKTVVGTVFGTPSHMSPEQFVDAASCDERSDIYSFGVVLHQMATGGALPFLPAPPPPHLASQAGMYYWFSFRRMHETEPPAPVRGPFAPLVARCLSKKPADRYQAFADLRKDLEALYEAAAGKSAPEGAAVEETPRDLNARGISLATLGRHQEALDCYDRALAREPDVAVYHSNRGNALRNLGRAAEALSALERAIGLDPLAAGPWLNKSLLYVHAQRNEDALSCIDRSLGLDPTSADGWVIRGVVLGRLGRQAEQLAAYDRALELDPRDASAWFNKANTLSLTDRAEALRCVDQALASDPNHVSAWSLKGTMLGEMGRAAESLPCHQEAVRLSPEEATLRYNLGNAFAALGRLEEARATYEDSARLDPGVAITWYNLGLATFRLGRHAESVPHFERFLSFNPPPDGLRATAERILRELRAGRVPQLGPIVTGARIDAAEKASIDASTLVSPPPRAAAPPPPSAPAPAARRPDSEPLPAPMPSIDALNRQAVTCFNEGRLDACMEAVNAILRLDPRDGYALNTRANALFRQGRKDEACEATTAAIEASPGDLGVWRNRALIQQAAGRAADACRSAIDLVEIARAAGEKGASVEEARQLIGKFQAGGVVPAERTHLGWLGLGFASIVAGRKDAGLSFLDKAIEAAPNRVESLRWKGSALKESKRADDALAMFDRALAIAPDDPEIHHDRGVVLAMLRDLPRAIEAFDRALALNPDHVASLSDKGKYAGEAGRKEDAWRALRRAAALRPDHPAPWLNKALIEDVMGLEEDALASFEKFLERAKPDMRLQIESSKRRVAQLKARIAARAGASAPISPASPAAQGSRTPAQTPINDPFLKAVAGLFTADDADVSDEDLARLAKAMDGDDAATLLDMLRKSAGPAPPQAPPDRPVAKPTGNPVARKWAEQGRALAASARPAEALAAFEKAIERDPNESAYWALKGDACRDLSRQGDARAAWERALDLDGGCVRALIGLAGAERLAGNEESAIRLLKQAGGLEEDNAEAWFALGDLYRKREEWANAFPAFGLAVQADRHHVPALVGLGEAALNLGRSDDALVALDTALGIDAGVGAAHFLRGVALANTGDLPGAAAAQRRAVEIDPGQSGAWYNLAHNLHAMKRHAEAIEAADRALALRPGFALALNTKGLALAALGRFKEAVAVFDLAVKADPDLHQAWTNRGLSLMRLDRQADAFESFTKALEIKPDHQSALDGRRAVLAALEKGIEVAEERQKHAESGIALPEAALPKTVARFSQDECLKRSEMTRNQALFDQAIEWADQAIVADPRKYTGWLAKAEALFGAKRFAEAAAHARKALDLNSKLVAAWSRLAACYDALEAPALALPAWETTVGLAPRNVLHLCARAQCLAKLGRAEEALAVHEEALVIDPRFSLAKFHKGMIEADLGRREAATQSLQQFLALAPPNLAAMTQQARQRLQELKA